MKKRIFLAFVGGACAAGLIAGGISVNQTRTARNRERKLQALQEQVELLGQTVVALRKELGELREREKRLTSLGSLPPAPTEAPRPAIQRRLPSGPPAGQPFEFNGRTYYLTPLERRADIPTLVAR
jgi:hypothetical protein